MSLLLEGENMNQPDAQTAPNYVACSCQHCSGKIEFDANQLDLAENTTVPCPHCGLETIIFVPEKKVPPISPPPIISDRVKTWLENAQNGDSSAQCCLGFAYESGQEVPHSYVEAIKWWRKAAEQGNAYAQCSLGSAYSLGEELPQNDVEAVKWWQKAAEQGVPDAQSNLGYAYLEGRGIPQNFFEAYKWANLAAAAGSKVAKQVRDDASKMLSPSQIAEAQRQILEKTASLANAEGNDLQVDPERFTIPSAVRREVWRRDEGKCVKCGSRAYLEYDHIIPVSRGGSNTARNIELLCEACNRAKSDLIQ
jgi:hypothetical protein